MLKITGALILVVGMLAGLALVTSPFGIFHGASASPAAWILFPSGFVAGAVLLALGDSGGVLGGVWRLCAAFLLSLTVASAIGLVIVVLGAVEPVAATASLWYVLLVAGTAGTACALGPARIPSTQSAQT